MGRQQEHRNVGPTHDGPPSSLIGMTVPGGAIRLRRSLGARLFSGWPLQPVLTIVLLLSLALDIFVSTFGGWAVLLRSFLPAVPIYAIWIIGLSASAHADGDGIRWRYFIPRRYSWAEIECIEFGGAVTSTMGGTPAILVTAGGHEHAIGPGFGVKRRYQAEFAEGIRTLAANHDVTATVQDGSVFWTPLLGS